jgi:hypothetical protein
MPAKSWNSNCQNKRILHNKEMKGSWKSLVDGALIVTVMSGWICLLGYLDNEFYYSYLGVPSDLIDFDPIKLMITGGLDAFMVLFFAALIVGIILLICKLKWFQKQLIDIFSLDSFLGKWFFAIVVIGVFFIAPCMWIENMQKKSAAQRLKKSPHVSVTTKSSRILPDDLCYFGLWEGELFILCSYRKRRYCPAGCYCAR